MSCCPDCGLRLFPILPNSCSLSAKEMQIILLLYTWLWGNFNVETWFFMTWSVVIEQLLGCPALLEEHVASAVTKLFPEHSHHAQSEWDLLPLDSFYHWPGCKAVSWLCMSQSPVIKGSTGRKFSTACYSATLTLLILRAPFSAHWVCVSLSQRLQGGLALAGWCCVFNQLRRESDPSSWKDFHVLSYKAWGRKFCLCLVLKCSYDLLQPSAMKA